MVEAANQGCLTVAIVNPTLRRLDLPWKLRGVKLAGAGTRWQIAGSDPMAYNDPDKPPRVVIEESTLSNPPGQLWVAPCSVTLYAFSVR